jgi:sporulation protein YlmC with PRC-barrel domain
MKFNYGVSVFSAKGDKIGTVEQVVVDPRTKEVSHAIVKQGFLFTESKVLPVDLIAEATDERVTLKEAVDDLKALPKFEESYYVKGDVPSDAPPTTPAVNAAWPLYYFPPDEPGKSLIPKESGVHTPRYVRRVDRNVPEGAIVLEEKAEVMSADGEHVGDVAKVLADSESNRITHIVISRGLLFKEERRVPVSWIDKVAEETVYLAIESSLLNTLRPYTSA